MGKINFEKAILQTKINKINIKCDILYEIETTAQNIEILPLETEIKEMEKEFSKLKHE